MLKYVLMLRCKQEDYLNIHFIRSAVPIVIQRWFQVIFTFQRCVVRRGVYLAVIVKFDGGVCADAGMYSRRNARARVAPISIYLSERVAGLARTGTMPRLVIVQPNDGSVDLGWYSLGKIVPSLYSSLAGYFQLCTPVRPLVRSTGIRGSKMEFQNKLNCLDLVIKFSLTNYCQLIEAYTNTVRFYIYFIL